MWNCLKDAKGIIHYHDKFPDKNVPDKPLKEIQEAVKNHDRKFEFINQKLVKHYAPGISHYVFDIGIDER